MKNGTGLTRRQQCVYDYLRRRQKHSEPPPTLQELCEALSLRSRGSMHKHVQALIQAGLVEPMHGKQRGIRLQREATMEPNQLPLLGFIAAGHPLEAVEVPGNVDVPGHILRDSPCFVLQVKGNSMIEDGILDGDWVVVEQRNEARNGELVVALIDGTEATLKRIVQRPGEIMLSPANRDMDALILAPERVQIQGVVVGQMRSYR